MPAAGLNFSIRSSKFFVLSASRLFTLLGAHC